MIYDSPSCIDSPGEFAMDVNESARCLAFFLTEEIQLMVNCWFGARWFGFLESHYERDWDSWVYP